MRHAVVSNQNDVRRVTHRGEPAGGLLGGDDAVLGCAPLHVNTPEVRVCAQRRLGIVDGGWRIPFRRVLSYLEARIVRLEILNAAVGAIRPFREARSPSRTAMWPVLLVAC